MTHHYYENAFIKLHYYKYGEGSRHMLCFHGFGMHGKQFRVLEVPLGNKYTFWGFDLFFHKETSLKEQTLEVVKKGLSKQSLSNLIIEFCNHHQIERFSVIGYSMGSHYATVIVEEIPERIEEYIIAAPSSINPGALVRFFSGNRLGNKLLEKLALSEKALLRMLDLFHRLKFIDAKGREILYNEVNTPQLRFALYACFTYLRFLETDESRLISAIRSHHIRSIFIFGKRDAMYLPRIGKAFFRKLTEATVVVLDENHEMINQNFASVLANLFHDY